MLTYEEYCDYSFSDFAEANRYAIEESLKERLGTMDGFDWASEHQLVTVEYPDREVDMEEWLKICPRLESQYVEKFFWDEAERFWQRSKETSKIQKMKERDDD